MGMVLALFTFAFALWLGLYLIERDPRKRRLRYSGFGLIAYALVVWYVVDTASSLYSGVPANALFNTAFLVLFAIPPATTYGHFRHGTKPSERQEVYEGLRRQG